MKINLAEIWDYNLEFMDWKTTSLMNADKEGQVINPVVTLSMDSRQAIKN